ncbi:hypothetical protein FFLO_01788 [Filobasidium floriforme]|uniref:Exocyst complex component SEC15 n=2 Tax=Filobasidium floriforme TaxID=5210 RepID=A0A8K0NUJ1_9TREE|nr:hypothetical protein FFLO_01788 [Filobasidium floriforme]
MSKKRPTYTNAEIETHLSQLSIPATGGQENLEALAPLVVSLQDTSTEQVYLRSLDRFVEEKEKQIEEICGDNYEDFVSSVSTLLSVRQGTAHLRRRIGELDGQMGDVGRALTDKASSKRALLKQRKIAQNIDEAIDTLQTCLRVLDLVNRVRDMINEGKHFAALRAMEDLQTLPPSAISETPFFQHIMSSLPSLHAEIKSAVTASEKNWLLDMREVSAQVGRLALIQMETRMRKWKSKQDRDPGLRHIRVGDPIELASNDKTEFDPLNNDQVQVDLRPLLQCIHIYNALECRPELQRNYQEDRKQQANLIFSQRSTINASSIKTALQPLLEDLVGFFIIEKQVLRICRDFRTSQEVDLLWDEMCDRIARIVSEGLKTCEDLETFLAVKPVVLAFEQTLQGYGFDVSALSRLLMTLFERYSNLLQRKFSAEFDQIVMEDDNQPMMVQNQEEFDQVVSACWLATGEAEQIAIQGFPQALPFSQTFPMCCINIRNFVDQFYQFVEGVPHRRSGIDEVLRRSLDGLLISHVSKNICDKVNTMKNLSQVAQVVINVEHFVVAVDELESVLVDLKYVKSTLITLQSGASLQSTLEFAQSRIDKIIADKLDQFFEMGWEEFDWTPKLSETYFDANTKREPSTYLFEMITFLTAYVDSVLIGLREDVRGRAYRGALEHVRDGLLNLLVTQDIPKANEQAFKNLLDDIEFVEREMGSLGLDEAAVGLGQVFGEIKGSINLILSDSVQLYVSDPSVRASHAQVRPRNLKIMLEKLARWTPEPTRLTGADAERMAGRRRQADSVANLLASS